MRINVILLPNHNPNPNHNSNPNYNSNPNPDQVSFVPENSETCEDLVWRRAALSEREVQAVERSGPVVRNAMRVIKYWSYTFDF